MQSLDDMDPMDAYVSVARLVDAMGAKATRTGDLEGYEEALRLLLDTAERLRRRSTCGASRRGRA